MEEIILDLFVYDATSPIGLKPTREIFCEMKDCGGKCTFWGAHFLEFPLKGEPAHACDVSYICNKCGLIHLFGVPISQAHFKAYQGKAKTTVKKDESGITYYKLGRDHG